MRISMVVLDSWYNNSVRTGHVNPTNEQVYQFRKKGHVNPRFNCEKSYSQYKGHVNPLYGSPADKPSQKGYVNPQVYGRNFKKRFDKANQNQNRLQNQYVKANSAAYKPRVKDHHSAPLLKNQYVECIFKYTVDSHNALLDTGAHFNHLSEQFVRDTPYLRALPRQETKARATVADGRSVPYL